jgi:hypothetical protein
MFFFSQCDLYSAFGVIVRKVLENGQYTVTKSEPKEASHWKFTFQKREISHVDTGTFIPPSIWFFLCGKSDAVYGRGHFTGL